MTTAREGRARRPSRDRELAELRTRLAETEEALRAVQRGEVDAVVVSGTRGPQVFSLEGTGHSYRVMIESMNEGALTLSTDGVVLYANQRFASMVRMPLEEVQGASVFRFLSDGDRALLARELERKEEATCRLQLQLLPADGGSVPVHVSLSDVPLGRRRDDIRSGAKGVVVSDMSDVRKAEGMLRAFAHFMVRARDIERERVFGELHDNISQRLCGVLVRWKALADSLVVQDETHRSEVQHITSLLRDAAEEVRHVSETLHPHGLAVVGLMPAVRAAVAEFEERTGVRVRLTCPVQLPELPAGADVALYRILQDALENVDQHARADRVEIHMEQQDAALELQVHDDGVGFDPSEPVARPEAPLGFGLLGMRERANSVGGSLYVSSVPGGGTRVVARVPVELEAEAEDEAEAAG